jgi:acid phosphatase family membrane protein YuiD
MMTYSLPLIPILAAIFAIVLIIDPFRGVRRRVRSRAVLIDMLSNVTDCAIVVQSVANDPRYRQPCN